jgi:hypothetical protein
MNGMSAIFSIIKAFRTSEIFPLSRLSSAVAEVHLPRRMQWRTRRRAGSYDYIYRGEGAPRFIPQCEPRAVIRIRVRRSVIRVRVDETAIRVRIVVRPTDAPAMEGSTFFESFFFLVVSCC